MKTAIEWVEIANRRYPQTQPCGTYKWVEDIQSDVIMDVARFIRERQMDATKARKEALDVVMEKLDKMFMRKCMSNKTNKTKGKISASASPLLLGDVVYRCNTGGGMFRLTDCGNESYDLFLWNGQGWSFEDSIGFESARRRLKNSWEVYVRAVT